MVMRVSCLQSLLCAGRTIGVGTSRGYQTMPPGASQTRNEYGLIRAQCRQELAIVSPDCSKRASALGCSRLLASQRPVQGPAVLGLDRLGEGNETRDGPSQRSRYLIDGAVSRVSMAVLDMRDPALVVSKLKTKILLRDADFFSAKPDGTPKRDLGVLGGVRHAGNPLRHRASAPCGRFHIDVLFYPKLL
jgi:hypothetical protein